MTLFTKAIEGNECTLVKFIDIDHGLWIELQARQILTYGQIADCRSQVSHLSISEMATAFYILISTVPGAAKNNSIKSCFCFLGNASNFLRHFTCFFEFND